MLVYSTATIPPLLQPGGILGIVNASTECLGPVATSVTICLVGMLAGDAWMTVPALRDYLLSQPPGTTLELICGSYAQPVWQWAADHITGCDWKIVRVVADPDDAHCLFCPGFGYIAMDRALAFVKATTPGKVVWIDEIGSYYSQCISPELGNTLNLKDRSQIPSEPSHTTVHAYTCHDWKNCGLVVANVTYHRPVEIVGLPDEFDRVGHPPAWRRQTGFDTICQSILSASGFVGVLSSWTNFAALFRIPQVVVSFTTDVQLTCNPGAVVLVKPECWELQREVDRIGL